ncbi:MAG: hypothetical protein M1840_003836 [Geoglossum simile]|nr:MAG: hypothetical protein M1840_003836 [Geoglossum simile]
MASVEVIPKTARTSSRPSTPPQTPNQIVGSPISPDHIQQFLDILKRATPTTSDPASSQKENKPAEIKGKKENETEEKIRASKLEFKMVNETWSKSAYKYVIEESQESTTKEDDKWIEYIFVARKKFGMDLVLFLKLTYDNISQDKENKYYTEYMDIKSEGLQNILCEVFKDVSGVSLRGDKPSVHPALLVNFLPQLKAYQTIHSMESSIQHLRLLIQYITDHYNAEIKRFNTLLEEGKISFDLLWILFQPNTVVHTTCPGSDQPRYFKFDSGQMEASSQGECFFKLDCRYFDYDGKVFGEVEIPLGIPQFRGVKKINTLNVFPLKYHEQVEELKDTLVARGQKFISLMGMHHRYYKGIAFVKRNDRRVKFYVESRIMIDASEFNRADPNYSSLRIRSHGIVGEEPTLIHWGHLEYPPENDPKPVKTNGKSSNEMKEDDLLLCTATVLGFSLSNKRWAEFAVAYIEEIVWDPLSFECLVIRNEKKNIIRALAESHKIKAERPFDDFVKGKEQGLIILLHGPAGVGKTLTAEGISELLRRPLYSVCAGDLGVDSTKLEDNLTNILHLARHWNAMLLLDEADVFLEQRSHENVNRNALVSVFLRQLEYFQGAMFLTTNRVKTFDEAFHSRIHFALRYEKLGKSARAKVWTEFLNRSGPNCLSQKNMESLAEKDLNGRQIKNAVRTALALAMNEGKKMSYEHLDTVLQAIDDFNRDFKGSGQIENLSSYT